MKKRLFFNSSNWKVRDNTKVVSLYVKRVFEKLSITAMYYVLNKCDPCVYFTFVQAYKVEGGFMCLSKKVSGEATLFGL